MPDLDEQAAIADNCCQLSLPDPISGRRANVAFLRKRKSKLVMPKVLLIILVIVAGAISAGCQAPLTCPRTIYLDGAGWASGDKPIRTGLREAGFHGPVERFGWTSFLGPLPDHLMAGANHPKVSALADRVTALRRANPNGKIVLMGLSAGTCIVVHALEKLPLNVSVDYVVLLSPSISSRHDMTKALRHVKHRLYATSSPHDAILIAARSAGLESGRPAGQVGFKLPRHAGRTDSTRNKLYSKLVNLPWRPGYVAYGWDGGHVSVTDSQFIRVVIAPRIMDDQGHPLDRPMIDHKSFDN